MENNRPTEELILPNCQAKVTLYTFLTNGQLREIQKRTFAGVKVKLDKSGGDDVQGKIDLNELDAEIAFDLQDLALSYIVKQITDLNGAVIEDKTAFIYELTEADGRLLYDRVNTLTTPGNSTLSDEAKKKS